MRFTIKRNIVCSNPNECSDMIVSKLVTIGKFKSEVKGDIVNGSVSINHIPNNHVIVVEVYDNDEAPNKKHDGNFKKVTLPDQAKLEGLI